MNLVKITVVYRLGEETEVVVPSYAIPHEGDLVKVVFNGKAVSKEVDFTVFDFTKSPPEIRVFLKESDYE